MKENQSMKKNQKKQIKNPILRKFVNKYNFVSSKFKNFFEIIGVFSAMYVNFTKAGSNLNEEPRLYQFTKLKKKQKKKKPKPLLLHTLLQEGPKNTENDPTYNLATIELAEYANELEKLMNDMELCIHEIKTLSHIRFIEDHFGIPEDGFDWDSQQYFIEEKARKLVLEKKKERKYEDSRLYSLEKVYPIEHPEKALYLEVLADEYRKEEQEWEQKWQRRYRQQEQGWNPTKIFEWERLDKQKWERIGKQEWERYRSKEQDWAQPIAIIVDSNKNKNKSENKNKNKSENQNRELRLLPLQKEEEEDKNLNPLEWQKEEEEDENLDPLEWQKEEEEEEDENLNPLEWQTGYQYQNSTEGKVKWENQWNKFKDKFGNEWSKVQDEWTKIKNMRLLARKKRSRIILKKRANQAKLSLRKQSPDYRLRRIQWKLRDNINKLYQMEASIKRTYVFRDQGQSQFGEFKKYSRKDLDDYLLVIRDLLDAYEMILNYMNEDFRNRLFIENTSMDMSKR